jgi:excisionase family DNA binding protein
MSGETDKLLTIEKVIARLRVSRATFARLRRLGAGPGWLRLPGGQVRIRRSALEDWLRQTSVSDDHDEADAA